MNILYLIGNGFDLAQGMATSYPDFYASLSQYVTKNSFEKDIISDIQENIEQWSDLEEALGKATTRYKDPNLFRNALRFLNERLKEYLMSEESRARDTIKLSSQKLENDLLNPSLYLEEQGMDVFNEVINEDSTNVNIDVVSFNYTDTLERVLSPIRSATHELYSRWYYFREILHIHGTLDDMILVGVNDESQIQNESFRTDEFLSDDFIKPEINEGCQNRRNATFLRLINNAKIIVMFGVSIGITDNKWWKAIGQRINSNNPPLLLYFPFDPKKDTGGFPNYKRRWSKQYVEFLKERMQISRSVEDLSRRICIGINKGFLNLVEK